MSGPGGAPRDGECRECESLLASYVDGEAPTADRERIEKHIDACPCCRGWLA
nr:zf-HC2 domain-containing protein [Acidobacteriota bacterium]